jgi:selenium metabolism protein YedF
MQVIEVDARGLPCPRPVVETKKALEGIDTGTITVLVDNAESRDNVKRFAQSQGCQVDISEKDDIYYLDIVKVEQAESATRITGQTVALICTDRFGSGDERLGEILMKAFLNTLWDTEPRPAKLIFMNSGVRLTTEGSEMLDTLKLLETDGVEIFSCGTCLEYYDIKDKLRVGQVTNMYATVESLISADKVINI